MERVFLAQVDLLLRILPYVMRDSRFALKGGSAINLFVRDFPRLSVDIDLTYLPIEERNESLANISAILTTIERDLRGAMPQVEIQFVRTSDGRIRKLIVRNGTATVKVEPNETIRGCVFPTLRRDLAPGVEDEFGLFMSVQTLSMADLYGGKICAALDRQHPRDLFDIYMLLEREGLTPDIRKAFLVYLLSHNRPMVEILQPHRLSLESVFASEFAGMSRVPVTCETLIEVRERLISLLSQELSRDEKQFLISVKELNPDWDLLGLPGVENLPAVRWKLQNLARMSKPKREAATSLLRMVLNISS
jgi:predicted nucleotidyltransferase component of viral defense system